MSDEQEWRRIAEHAVRYPTRIVGSSGPSPTTRLGEAVLALLARLDAVRAHSERLGEIVAGSRAELDAETGRANRAEALAGEIEDLAMQLGQRIDLAHVGLVTGMHVVQTGEQSDRWLRETRETLNVLDSDIAASSTRTGGAGE